MEYREHKLKSGEIMSLTQFSSNAAPTAHPIGKPFEVIQYDKYGEVRWSKFFATLEEAEKEYTRFN